MAIRIKRPLYLVLAVILVLSAAVLPARQARAETVIPVTTEAELNTAISTAAAGDIIGLVNDITLSSDLTINKDVTIASDVGTKLIAGTHQIIIPSGSRVSFGGALSVTGSYTGLQGLIVVQGTLIIQKGAVSVTNSYTSPSYGVNSNVIYVDGSNAQLDLQGGVITDAPSQHNNASAAIYAVNDSYVVFTKVSGSSISVSGSAYGIYGRNGADISLYDGDVSGSCGVFANLTNGGGFLIHSGNNGSVTGTYAGVYVYASGAATLGDCLIYGGNITATDGCGLELSGASASIRGCSITGTLPEGGILVEDGATLDIYRDSDLFVSGTIRGADGSANGAQFLYALPNPISVLVNADSSFAFSAPEGTIAPFTLDAMGTAASLGASYNDTNKTVSLHPTATGTHLVVLKSSFTYNDGDDDLTQALKLTIPITVGSATIPVMNNVSRNNIQSMSATFSSGVYSDGGGTITEYGFVYSASDPTPEVGEDGVTTLSSANMGEISGTSASYTANVTGLTPGTGYYVRAYAVNAAGTGYTLLPSNTFTTLSVPTVTTVKYELGVNGLLWNQMNIYGNVVSDGTSAVTERGVVYTTVAASSGAANLQIGGTNVIKLAASSGGTGEYHVLVDPVSKSTTYYYRAYATNATGTAYGHINSVSMGSIQIHVETAEGGDIENPAGTVVNERGSLFYNGSNWVTNGTAAHTFFVNMETGGTRIVPQHDVAVTGAGTYGAGDYTVNVTTGSYTYTARAADGGSYAYTGREYRIAATYLYGNDLATDHIVLRSRGVGQGTLSTYFDTFVQMGDDNYITAIRSDPNWITYAGMTMDQALNAGESDGTLSGRLVSASDYYMDAQGGSDMGGISYVVHTGAFPAVRTLDQSSLYGKGFTLQYFGTNEIVCLNFTPALTGETYTPAGGTPTGNTSSGRSSAPNVVTTSVTDVTVSGAAFAGKVTSGGGAHVTERGFVIGLQPDPALDGADTVNIISGKGTGAFSAAADALLPGTDYYVRAYAVNTAGVSYGKTLSFTTGYIGDEGHAIPKTGDGCSYAGLLLLAAGAIGCALLRYGRKRT